MSHRHAILLAFISASCWAPAQAAPVTFVDPGIDTRVIRFSPYDKIDSVAVPALASTEVGMAEVFESVLLSFDDTSSERILGAVPIALGSNGSWPLSGAYAGLNAPSGNINFRFSRGMNFVGGFVNFDPGAFDGAATLVAFGANGDELETEQLTFANSADKGEFHGFLRSTADIWGFGLYNSRIVVDNLTFGTTAINVPEPTGIALVLAALGALALTRRRGA